MRKSNTRFALFLFATVLFIMLCLPFFSVLMPSAQTNPTVEKQTLDAIVARRFLQTESQRLKPTFDSVFVTSVPAELGPTVFPTLTAFVQTIFAGQTLTQAALLPKDLTATAAIEPTIDVIFGQALTATAMPTPIVPLKSDRYLNDNSFLSQVPCGPPCFRGITPGQTTFADALRVIQTDPQFSTIRSQEHPPIAAWSVAGGEPCCQLSADENTGLIYSVLIKVTPRVAIKDVISKYGSPDFVTTVDYSSQEVAIGLIFPKVGMATWVALGNAQSVLREDSPVVVVHYFDPKSFDTIYNSATYWAWNGYLPYQVYKNATPIVTPRFTITPQS